MSHQSVRDFYKALGKDSAMAERYKTLTSTWFLGYRTNRVLAFAAQAGFHFTADELKYVRLTNNNGASPMRPSAYPEDFVDLEPTAHPKPPEFPEEFFKEHGRKVG